VGKRVRSKRDVSSTPFEMGCVDLASVIDWGTSGMLKMGRHLRVDGRRKRSRSIWRRTLVKRFSGWRVEGWARIY